MEYRYGMRSRPFSIGCQPKGAVRVEKSNIYYAILIYDRKLTKVELYQYELEEV